MGKSRREIEIKLRVEDSEALRVKLRGMGARQVKRVHESNTLYDARDRRLGRAGRILRLRLESPIFRGRRRNRQRGLLTYKSPVKFRTEQGNRYKVRAESELPVAHPDDLHAVLVALGLRPWFQYEKIRTTYRLRGFPRLHADLDVTPIGNYLELEGSPKEIDEVAKRLGYAPRDYIPHSYWVLYRNHCRRAGRAPRHMVFPSKKK